ncbi:MAG: hypothetical protein AAFV86_11330 [Pseudomonadota bacterium]
MTTIDRLDDALTGETAKRAGLMALRVTTAGLMFWWGLVKGLDMGVGQAVSNAFYGGFFSVDALLIAFGWFQVVAAIALALGLLRGPLLAVQVVMNTFVAVAVWQSVLDPFWLFMPGEAPGTVNKLFYPSAIVAAGSLVLMAFRREDAWALDRLVQGAPRARPA